ncbi:hypothetical protein [Polymorphobacter megasporae]|uniref:hypothetical protein n=1 Tax=Glacieibacterium megasporae TaxID=2835787 RepID=UPI001C1E7AF1|nr:hypothetical protein [Polymorphobacter megasporae]UAJ10052.1 hypothetical protein KTC28_17535 [Polymorphobacter megasporae]
MAASTSELAPEGRIREASMNVTVSAAHSFQQVAQCDWLAVLDQTISSAEAAEMELSRQGENDPSEQRKASGSFYTPADVASHFWDLFFRHHRISDVRSLLAFTASHELVEPSAGSGMFVFSFLRKAALLGATPENLNSVRFHVVDINLAALRFFSERLRTVEHVTGARFDYIGPAQSDFLEWSRASAIPNAVFVGNPPFIANIRGARWRNLYADFVEAMLTYPTCKGVSLILPLSVCFSRDYADLRSAIRSAGMGISASSYDNIPDCLFKVGKPDSTNTNRANSQRCTILNIGGSDPAAREASALLSWPAGGRVELLSTVPKFRAFREDDPSGQIPRPASDVLANHMLEAGSARPLRTLLSKLGRPVFSVGGVARNYIGIRDYEAAGPGTIPIKVASEQDRGLVLQALSSELFFDYWRTYGDGFHVTVELIERFPLSESMVSRYRSTEAIARRVWDHRAAYAKEKLNSGRIVRSYDFRGAFR